MENSLKKSYPRAIPHRSPEEMAAQSDRLRASMERLAAQSARLRRWMFVLAAGFAGVLLFGAGSVIYLLNANSNLSVTAGPSPPTDNNEGVPLVSPTPPAPAAGPAVAGK